MEFGMPTLLETGTLAACAALCRELSLDFIELNMNLPPYQLQEMEVSKLQEIRERYAVSYTLHLDENLNVCDFNPYIAQGYLRTVAEALALARRLGIPILNMHLARGVYFTLPQGRTYLFAAYGRRYRESIAGFRSMCEDAAAGADVRICIENCEGMLPFQREALDMLLASPVFGLTFDVGHNHGCGGLDAPYWMRNADRICHMHLHDALGGACHLPLGTGELDLDPYLALARERNCRVVLETKTREGLRRSVQWLRKRQELGLGKETAHGDS